MVPAPRELSENTMEMTDFHHRFCDSVCTYRVCTHNSRYIGFIVFDNFNNLKSF